MPSTQETYWSPARRHTVALAINAPFKQTYDQVTVQNGAPDYVVTNTETATYLGRETVVTAFGSFETCKMQFDYAASAVSPAIQQYSWVVASGKLRGFAVQTQTNGKLVQDRNITVSWN